MVQAVSDAVQSIMEAFSNLVSQVSPILESLTELVSQLGDTIKDVFQGISDVVTSVGDAISGVLDSIAGIIESVGNSALNAGKGFKQMAQGLEIIVGLEPVRPWCVPWSGCDWCGEDYSRIQRPGRSRKRHEEFWKWLDCCFYQWNDCSHSLNRTFRGHYPAYGSLSYLVPAYDPGWRCCTGVCPGRGSRYGIYHSICSRVFSHDNFSQYPSSLFSGICGSSRSAGWGSEPSGSRPSR